MINDPLTVIATTKQYRPLPAIFGKSTGPLISHFTHRIAFNTNGQTCFIHHRKHVHQTAIFLTDQIPDSTFVVAKRHHAGRAGVNTQLMFYGHAAHIVALTGGAVDIK